MLHGRAIIGPIVGGAMLERFWWGSVFLLAVGPVLVPEYRDGAAGRLDVPSVVLSLAAVLPAIQGCQVARPGRLGDHAGPARYVVDARRGRLRGLQVVPEPAAGR